MGVPEGRDVLMGCHEPPALSAVAVRSIGGSGSVAHRGRAGGHVETLQAVPWLGWRAARLSRGCHHRRETWWDRGEMRCDELGTSVDVGTLGERIFLTGGQVVAGSNRVSPIY